MNMIKEISKIILITVSVFNIGFADKIELKYSDFTHVSSNEIPLITSKQYYLYYYSPTCYYCQLIEKDVLTFALKMKCVYFIDHSRDDNRCQITDSIPCISGTPTLFMIKQQVIEERLVGANKIADYIFNN